MKKSFAIFLLLIQMISLGGYRLYFSYFEKQASIQIVERLDGGGFSENELIEIKLPYRVPYAANWGEYERFDGEVEMNGVHYNYVKRKMLNDTLYLLCIPNTVKNELSSAKTDLIGGLNDLKNDGSSKQKIPVGSIVKPFTTEFSQLLAEYDFSITAGTAKSSFYSFVSAIAITDLQSPFQPPKC